MGLLDVVILRTKVEYGDTEIVVRGISANDLMTAATDFAPQMALAFAQVSNSGSMASGDIKAKVLDIAKEFPELVAAIIALASDAYTPKALDIARDLPFNTQLELIEGVFNNTFTSEADVKKLIESLTKMAVGASGALVQIRQTGLLSGTGE